MEGRTDLSGKVLQPVPLQIQHPQTPQRRYPLRQSLWESCDITRLSCDHHVTYFYSVVGEDECLESS